MGIIDKNAPKSLKEILDLWKDLEDRFFITNGRRIQQLKHALAECKQRRMTIMDYYEKLKQIWDELAVGIVLVILEKKREEEKVHLFLMGLDEQSYEIMKSNILAQDPMPRLNKVY
ncbi:hypothetical protein SADUNF_Sadunf16G0098600 [Salix dunnii]|uniref:Retrotransposon gag domain-containing protein n=1 Tax=Salix dunnii TaxID=1413687 RepID=A0A835MGI6_9ROSI|nr:hypothetical protein SADUNF_Sadunf16G0098600 [Salix dunnii]